VLLVFAYLGIFSGISAATRENADIGLITPAPFCKFLSLLRLALYHQMARRVLDTKQIYGRTDRWRLSLALASCIIIHIPLSPPLADLISVTATRRTASRRGCALANPPVHSHPLFSYHLTHASSSFPISYTILVLPLSVTRWVGWRIEKRTGSDLPPAAYLAAGALFQLTPFVNVVLIFMRGGIKLVKFERLERVPSPRTGASVDRMDIQSQPAVRMSVDTRGSDIVEEVTVLDRRLDKGEWKQDETVRRIPYDRESL
jgi:hypothetical protein